VLLPTKTYAINASAYEVYTIKLSKK